MSHRAHLSMSTIYNYITIVHMSLLQHSYTEHILKLACSNIVYKIFYQTTSWLPSKSRPQKRAILRCTTCTLNMVPRRGEQCPVENNFYKGYSPPKCKCNAIPHIQVKPYTFLLKCLHAMDENVTHPFPCPESSPTPSHMHMLSVKTVIYVP